MPACLTFQVLVIIPQKEFAYEKTYSCFGYGFSASRCRVCRWRKNCYRVTPFPHKDIMEVAKPILAKDGYELVIQEFSDYVQPNVALSESAGHQLLSA